MFYALPFVVFGLLGVFGAIYFMWEGSFFYGGKRQNGDGFLVTRDGDPFSFLGFLTLVAMVGLSFIYIGIRCGISKATNNRDRN